MVEAQGRYSYGDFKPLYDSSAYHKCFKQATYWISHDAAYSRTTRHNPKAMSALVYRDRISPVGITYPQRQIRGKWCV